ncbi:MAG: NUDIX hydrolase [Actinocrinis sp.]
MTGETHVGRVGESGLPIRVTARIVLADERDRILLFQYRDDESDKPGGVWWGTPGGGVDEGESIPHAASRELFEETGLRVPPERFDREVAHSEGRARFGGRDQWFEDHFYFLRADGFALDDSGWEDLERDAIAEYRWWTVAELEQTADAIYPPKLAALLPDLFAGRFPDEPIDADPS